MRKTFLLLTFAALLAGCSSEPPKRETATPAPKREVKKDEYETGRVAFQKTYILARGWAGDAKPFRLESQHTEGAPVTEGKAGVWRAVFVSTQRGGMKAFTWSGVNAENAPPRGVNPGMEDDYSPTNPSTQPFDLSFLKQDSDKAFEVAQKNGGEKIMKKDPKQPVMFLLDWSPKENKLKWHVVYGTSPREAKLRVAVDATTGVFLKVEK